MWWSGNGSFGWEDLRSGDDSGGVEAGVLIADDRLEPADNWDMKERTVVKKERKRCLVSETRTGT